MFRTLAIETSCDDTSVSIVRAEAWHFVVEQLKSFSQIDLHQQYGGVVPELAYRSHAEKIVPLLASLGDKDFFASLDNICVTAAPWLPGALVVGITTAYTLGAIYKLPVIEVDHIMWHVFSVLLERNIEDLKLPAICLTVSGGHNDIYVITDTATVPQTKNEDLQRHKRGHLPVWSTRQVGPFTVTKLAQTMDDAAGEVFDKVARMLDGPYPGGARIGQQALLWKENPQREFRVRAQHDEEWLFSFSGIKGQVQQRIQHRVTAYGPLTDADRADIAFGFQEAVVEALASKVAYYTTQQHAQSVRIVWGVSANHRLREVVQQHLALEYQTAMHILFPKQFVYCTDNAAMIGVCGVLSHQLDRFSEQARDDNK